MELNQDLVQYQQLLLNDFIKKQSNSPNSILIAEKLSKFQDQVGQRLGENCGKLQAEYEKFGNAEMQENEVKLTKIQGKEKDFDQAWDNYLACAQPILSALLPLQAYVATTNDFLNRSYQLCFSDCVSKQTDLQKNKECIKTCFDYNYENNYKAYEILLNEVVDLSMNDMQSNKNI